MVFVFGSNLAGRHGAGAALHARENYGAEYGVGIGPTGRSYAIPTKDKNLNVLPLDDIQLAVNDFIMYAIAHPETVFFVTRIGCGLAGYTDKQIAPLFEHAPNNCSLDMIWNEILNKVSVAQLEERCPPKAKVAGSSPAGDTK